MANVPAPLCTTLLQKHIGPGGHYQWRQVDGNTTTGSGQQIMMLTADLALLEDESYLALVQEYASDIKQLEKDFAAAWYKLMSRDMGPVTRCLGEEVPPPQPWQDQLPAEPSGPVPKAALKKTYTKVMDLLESGAESVAEADMVDGKPFYGAQMVQLAYRCAATYRDTNHFGGCNGARIALEPQSEWAVNAGLDSVIDTLTSMPAEPHSTAPMRGVGSLGSSPASFNVSLADTIVMAGNAALEKAGAGRMPFCAGRVDATAASEADLAPRVFSSDPFGVQQVKDDMLLAGLSFREGVALAGRLRSPVLQRKMGYSGSWASGKNITVLSNAYFTTLLGESWQPLPSAAEGLPSSNPEFTNANGTRFMTKSDLALTLDPELLSIVMEYAADNELFLKEFGRAWTKLMNADRFSGPAGNVCSPYMEGRGMLE